MAVKHKIYIPDKIYFITFTIYWWNNVFINDEYCNLMYRWFDYIKQKYWNKIHWYVIMPNHFHWLIYLSNTSPEIVKVIQNAKRFLAYGIVKLLNKDWNNELIKIFKDNANLKKKSKHVIFREWFDSKIMENRGLFMEKLKYIHNNPCAKHWDLAKNPEWYKHSSASNYILWDWVYNVDLVKD